MTNAILRGCLFIGGAAALLLWTAPDSFGLDVHKPISVSVAKRERAAWPTS